MRQPYIFSIQKFSVHDGPGIRTTVFFKGCPLSCPWCHNPESKSFHPELLLSHDRCTGCGACVKQCLNGANTIQDGKLFFSRELCTGCGICTDWCISEARSVAGKTYTIRELVRECEKDRDFYEQSGGGITLSGGEVMCQDMDYIEELCRILHEKGYSVDIDTSGYAPYENFTRILPYVDTFLYDIKRIKKVNHLKHIGVDNTIILENLKHLSDDGAKIFLRLPLIANVNATTRFVDLISDFLHKENIRIIQINLLPYHNTGQHKYDKLDLPYDVENTLQKPDTHLLEELKARFISHGFPNVKIGG